MGYKVITKDGESYVNDLNILTNLAQSGVITAQSKIYDTEKDIWTEASNFEQLTQYLKVDDNSSPYNHNIHNYNDPYKVPKSNHNFLYLLSILLLSFGLICGYSNVVDDLRQQNSVDSGYIMGGMFFYIAILVAGITIINKKAPRSERAKKTFIFSLIYLLIVFVGSIGSGSLSREQERTQREAAGKEVFFITKDFVSSNEIGTKTYDKSIYGPYTDFLYLHRNLYANLAKDTAAREQELKVLNLDKLYTAEIFFNSASISSGEERISIATKIIDKYISLFNDRINKHRVSVNQSEVPADFKNGYLSSFHQPDSSTMEVLELYKQSLIKYNEVLKYVSGLNGNYSVSNDVLMLYNQNTLEQYNKLLSEYQQKYREYQTRQISTELQIKNKLQLFENELKNEK